MEQVKRGYPESAKNFDIAANSARLDLPSLMAITGKSRPTIYRWIKKGILPNPTKFGACHNSWSVGDVRAALGITQQGAA